MDVFSETERKINPVKPGEGRSDRSYTIRRKRGRELPWYDSAYLPVVQRTSERSAMAAWAKCVSYLGFGNYASADQGGGGYSLL